MKFSALDSLRGIAATLVVLVHLSAAGYFYDIPLIRGGGQAVPLFFVLSGFVIAHAYGQRLNTLADLRAFAIRRFGRLYPLHLVTLLVLVVLEVVKLVLTSSGDASGEAPFAGANSLETLLANLVLLQAVIPFGVYSWNGPSWSISTEFWTYAVFAILVVLSAQHRLRATAAAAGLVAAVILGLPLLGVHLRTMTGLGMLVCLFCFFLGVIAYRTFRWLHDRGFSPNGAWEWLVLPLALIPFWFDLPGSLAAPLVFAVVVVTFAFASGPVSRGLDTATFRFLGKISYSIYMVHFVILAIFNGLLRVIQGRTGLALMNADGMIDFGPPGSMDLLAVVYLAVVIGLGTLSYYFIESPCRDFFNKIADRQPLSVAYHAGKAGFPALGFGFKRPRTVSQPD